MSLIVQKFGGSSVKDVERMKEVARRVIEEAERGNQVVAAVSAMGNTTDELLAMADQIMEDPPAREVDMLLASGEQISSAILAIAIESLGKSAIALTGPQVGIETDSVHGRARIVHINDARIRAALDEGKIVIVAGFQGVTGEQEITTLGRGGSDTTAVALAAALEAERCDIFTDVDGVYTADPKIVPGARRLDSITYDEMLEMASLGAQVLHGRSVELAKNYQVPLRVLSSFNNSAGTMVVQEYQNMENFIVRAVALDRGQAKISLIGVPDKPGMAAALFTKLGDADVPVDMIIQNIGSDGRNDISFTVNLEDFRRTELMAREVCGEIGALEVQTVPRVAKLSVVGVGMKTHSGVAGKMFRAMASEAISIQTISTSEICVSCLIDLDRADDALRAVHKEFGLSESAEQ